MNSYRSIFLPALTPTSRRAKSAITSNQRFSSQAPLQNTWLQTKRTCYCTRLTYRFFSGVQRWLCLSLSLATLLISAPVHAVKNGTPTDFPWVVQLISSKDPNTVQICTGAAINDYTIITASHCDADSVNFSNRTALIHSRHDIEGTRIRLIFLTAPHPLSQYTKLGPNYFASGTVVPPGTTAQSVSFNSDNYLLQESATLAVNLHSKTSDTPEVFSMTQTGNGAMYPGDSGAPLLINNLLVAVLRGPGKLPIGPDTHYIYTGISPALDRIAKLVYERKIAMEDQQRKIKAFIATEF